jgi:predicted N-formylglutamate amidohydrolase
MSGTFPNTALINSEFGHDIGTKDVILLLIEKLECIGALANFSKLVVDPNRTVYDSALIPAYVNGEKIEFNQGKISVF